ncbi:MAG: EpsI family protein [Acidobacteria bacterium]|nr:EpsI family protein [Acidobacteriota bacterium]
MTRMLVLVMCFAAGVGLLARADRPEPVPVRSSFNQFPMQLGEWNGVQDPPFPKEILAILGVDDYMARAYFRPNREGVGVYVGYYGSQRQGDTMHSPQNCLPGAGWEPVSNTLFTIQVPDSAAAAAQTRPIEVNRYLIRKGLDRQLVLYWYQSHGRVVASEYWSKFYLIRDAVQLNRTDGALVRVIAPIAGNSNSDVAAEGERHAEELAVQFVQDLFPALNGYLPQ